MSLTILQQLRARLTHKREQAAGSYDQLVKEIAEGQGRTKPDVIETLLTQVNRTLEQLEADVARVHARRAAAEAVKRGEAARAELDALHAKAAAAEQAHQLAVGKLVDAHAEAAAALERKARELERIVEAGQAGAAVLRETADRSATAGQAAALRQQLDAARRRRDVHTGRAVKAGALAKEAATTLTEEGRGNFTVTGRQLSTNRGYYEQQLAAAEHDEREALKDAEGPAEECRRLEAQLAELDAAALVP